MFSAKPLAKNEMTKLQFFTSAYLLVFFTLSTSMLSAQKEPPEFQQTAAALEGCWHSKYYQFKYDSERNLGCEYQSRVRSSAPIFNLIEKNEGIYLQWLELIGGEHLQKVIWVNKNKFKVCNEDGSKTTYRRSKDCK
jgi:hypothetical protein